MNKSGQPEFMKFTGYLQTEDMGETVYIRYCKKSALAFQSGFF